MNDLVPPCSSSFILWAEDGWTEADFFRLQSGVALLLPRVKTYHFDKPMLNLSGLDINIILGFYNGLKNKFFVTQ